MISLKQIDIDAVPPGLLGGVRAGASFLAGTLLNERKLTRLAFVRGVLIIRRQILENSVCRPSS